MKVVAFAASNSQHSINKKLVTYVAGMIEHADLDILDLRDYELPIFSMEREAELGQPERAKQFLAKLSDADAIVISFAEHNGMYSAAFKNLFDWMSRIEKQIFQDTPMILLATSPGKGGGARVLAVAQASVPHFGAQVKASVSVPSFGENFDVDKGQISNPVIDAQLKAAITSL